MPLCEKAYCLKVPLWSIIYYRKQVQLPLGQAVHRKVMNDFRQYLLVGGMPQAVKNYVDAKDFEAVDRVKKRILTLYREDITKFARGYEGKVLALFDEMPSQLARAEKNTSFRKWKKEPDFGNMKMPLCG